MKSEPRSLAFHSHLLGHGVAKDEPGGRDIYRSLPGNSKPQLSLLLQLGPFCFGKAQSDLCALDPRLQKCSWGAGQSLGPCGWLGEDQVFPKSLFAQTTCPLSPGPKRQGCFGDGEAEGQGTARLPDTWLRLQVAALGRRGSSSLVSAVIYSPASSQALQTVASRSWRQPAPCRSSPVRRCPARPLPGVGHRAEKGEGSGRRMWSRGEPQLCTPVLSPPYRGTVPGTVGSAAEEAAASRTDLHPATYSPQPEQPLTPCPDMPRFPSLRLPSPCFPSATNHRGRAGWR